MALMLAEGQPDRFVSHAGGEWHSLFSSSERVANKRVYSPTENRSRPSTAPVRPGPPLRGDARRAVEFLDDLAESPRQWHSGQPIE
jgi:hypothetical protein